MAPGKHSEFSPSGMGDKLLCLGRHWATKGMNNGSSPAADRGTECHEWAEKLIFDANAPVPDFVESWQEGCTRDMVGHALEIYDELSLSGDVTLQVEQQVNLGWVRPNKEDFDMSRVFGTVDVLMWSEETGTLVVLDYKTGKGIEVDPELNTQLMIYAIGAMDKVDVSKIKEVRIVVSQPRIHDEAVEWRTTPQGLVMWCHKTLAPALEIMDKPGAPLTPGKKQCQWCPLGGKCQAQKKEMLSLLDKPVETEPSCGDIVPPEEIDALLQRHGEFKQWLNQLEGVAQGLMESGTTLPSFKLVHGRGSRNWADEEAAEKFLKGQKLKEKERYTYKLLSVPQAEKVLKDKLKKVTVTKNKFDSLVEKKQGKITWALRTDKREEYVPVSVDDLMMTADDL